MQAVPRAQPTSSSSAGASTLTDLVEPLTARERTILGFLASHLSFPQIGAELFIARHTVKSHVRRIYRKLDSSSRSEAIDAARRLGLLDALDNGRQSSS